MRTSIIVLLTVFLTQNLAAQFHTLNMPQGSPRVQETQRLGITEITLDYGSPAVRNRDVWNDVIPQGGDPIAWRAGANMATTIEFSTDVKIEGKPLQAGKYGLHIIPQNDTYTLLFAHNYNQWGSYYLDRDNDITMEVTVQPETCTTSEQLDYEFLNRTENSLVIGLEWGEKRIPFKIEVDLNKTVVESLRSELRGINTYHWQAWNDAARWCLDHDTNLEEAYEWVNRSINGGYNGFAAHRDIRNLVTKVNLIAKLGKTEELQPTLDQAQDLVTQDWEANYLTQTLLRDGFYEQGLKLTDQNLKTFPKAWFLHLNKSLAHYFLGDKKKALNGANKALDLAPEPRKARIREIISEINAGNYQFPS
ncbi:DUF2911 domain-containing protein [Flagellimonas nanhaiensis]|uniref:DUF2911 domain-containing protein n=1 Tax=Flagellimonas nanhaiensis TaxID=2292706 RepID=A0A371JLB2_9FLAO|nr:DUF2911 domain-containing protein [Allomuricauda nanhaiensis]RDY57740.1 DUF2911 domain-containing protein [Allomuricauda nanhaiensis]